MEGVYLNGSLKLKPVSFSNIVLLGVLLEKHGLEGMVANKKIALLTIKKLCIKKKGAEIEDKITPILTAKIVIDFFSAYIKSLTEEKKSPPLKLSLEDMEPFTFLTKTADKIRERNMKKYA